MQIGVYGGTFNPIHLGHLRSAQEILDKFSLREIVFVPSSIPPHKDPREIADPMHRLKMANLAVTGNSRFTVSEVEIHKKGKCYTIETIRALKEKYREEELVFIIGADAFAEIETWHKYRDIFAECDFIVHSRAGFAKKGKDLLPASLKDDFKKAKEGMCVHRLGKSLQFTEVTALDISATAIRSMAREGRSYRYLVPRRVGEYIQENGLYK